MCPNWSMAGDKSFCGYSIMYIQALLINNYLSPMAICSTDMFFWRLVQLTDWPSSSNDVRFLLSISYFLSFGDSRINWKSSFLCGAAHHNLVLGDMMWLLFVQQCGNKYYVSSRNNWKKYNIWCHIDSLNNTPKLGVSRNFYHLDEITVTSEIENGFSKENMQLIIYRNRYQQ